MPEVKRPIRVFLCHASQDKPAVRELYQRLMKEDWIDPWLDEEKLTLGQHWTSAIEDALDAADVVVIFLSQNSVQKEGFVQRELNYAWEISLEKPRNVIFLIPFRLDTCEVPRYLRSRQWGDYFGEEKEQTYQTLLRSLKVRHEQKLKLEEAERARKEKLEAERIAREEAIREKAKKNTDEKARLEAEEQARQKAVREKAEREAVEKAERDAKEKAEREAAEKLAREKADKEAKEKAEREAAEKAAQEKARLEAEEQTSQKAAREKVVREEAKRESVAKAKREKDEHQTARNIAFAKMFSNLSGSSQSVRSNTKSILRAIGILGIVAVLLWFGLWGIPKLVLLMPTAETNSTLQIVETPSSVVITTLLTNTPSSGVFPTKTLPTAPTPYPTPQPTPLGEGILVFAKGTVGKQDLYAIQGDGLGLTRLTSEAGYIGYKWSGCDCSGTKSISGYNFVMELSPNQKFLYYYYAPLGERKLRVVNITTLKTIVDISAPYGSSLAWSPDGTKTAYTEYMEEGVESINVVDSDGQNPVKVGQGQQIDNIGWGMDDHILFYTESLCRNQDVTVIQVNLSCLTERPAA